MFITSLNLNLVDRPLLQLRLQLDTFHLLAAEAIGSHKGHATDELVYCRDLPALEHLR